MESPCHGCSKITRPPLDTAQLIKDVKYAQEIYLAEGLTSIQDVNTRGLTRMFAYVKTALEGDLGIRVFMHHTIESPHDALLSINNTFLFKYPMLSLWRNKFLLDGQPPTSYTYEPHLPFMNFPTWNPIPFKIMFMLTPSRRHYHSCNGDAAIDWLLMLLNLLSRYAYT